MDGTFEVITPCNPRETEDKYKKVVAVTLI